MSAGQQVHINDPFPYKGYRYDQDRAGYQQTRFDERYNRQYSPNYNYYQPFPLVSIAGPDLSTTLIDLANVQSRSLDPMVANKDKANEGPMFTTVNTYDRVNGPKFEEWIDKLDQACQISGHDFRTKINKKSIEAV